MTNMVPLESFAIKLYANITNLTQQLHRPAVELSKFRCSIFRLILTVTFNATTTHINKPALAKKLSHWKFKVLGVYYFS